MRRERALKICACIGWTALLRSRLSACADGEARPCSGDDDESLRDTRRLLAGRFPQPLSASQRYRLCGVVELCARHCHGSAGISKLYRSQRTDRVGCVHRHRSSPHLSGSGKAVTRSRING